MTQLPRTASRCVCILLCEGPKSGCCWRARALLILLIVLGTHCGRAVVATAGVGTVVERLEAQCDQLSRPQPIQDESCSPHALLPPSLMTLFRCFSFFLFLYFILSPSPDSPFVSPHLLPSPSAPDLTSPNSQAHPSFLSCTPPPPSDLISFTNSTRGSPATPGQPPSASGVRNNSAGVSQRSTGLLAANNSKHNSNRSGPFRLPLLHPLRWLVLPLRRRHRRHRCRLLCPP